MPRPYYNPEKHHRKSIRSKGYDYTATGYYFVTICCQHHECLFGEIRNIEMMLNSFGDIVQNCWFDLPNHYTNVESDEFVIMPNHLHGIIILNDLVGDVDSDNVGAGFKPALGVKPARGAGFKPAPTTTRTVKKHHGLPEIVRAFKTFSSRRINKIRNTPGQPVWQRNLPREIT